MLIPAGSCTFPSISMSYLKPMMMVMNHCLLGRRKEKAGMSNTDSRSCGYKHRLGGPILHHLEDSLQVRSVGIWQHALSCVTVMQTCVVGNHTPRVCWQFAGGVAHARAHLGDPVGTRCHLAAAAESAPMLDGRERATGRSLHHILHEKRVPARATMALSTVRRLRHYWQADEADAWDHKTDPDNARTRWTPWRSSPPRARCWGRSSRVVSVRCKPAAHARGHARQQRARTAAPVPGAA